MGDKANIFILPEISGISVKSKKLFQTPLPRPALVPYPVASRRLAD